MIFRRLIVWLTNFFLGLCLFLLATVVSLIFTIGSANYIKNSLLGSGFYDKFTGSILKLATAQSTNDTNNQKLITELTPTIQRVVTPSFVKTSFGTAIDAFDHWLNGKVSTPSFSINLVGAKSDLKNEVAIYLQNKVNGLPLCQNYNNVIDPLNATCKPPINLTLADYQLAADNFVGTVPLLDKQTVAINSLDVNNNKKTVWQRVPLYNKIFRLSSWVLIVVSLLGIGLIILLSRGKARAIKIIGHTFIWSGAMLLVSGALSIFILGRNSSGFVGRGSVEQIAFMQDLIAPLLSKFAVSFGSWALYFGAGYAIFGGICYFISHRIKLGTKQNEQNKQEIIV